MSPLEPPNNQLSPATEFETNSPSISPSTAVTGIVDLISTLSDLTNSAPPDQGPRRFGNISFRRWLELVNTQLQEPRFLDQFLPASVLEAKTELIHYLLGSFGSGERLDYGTGHELSFAAFLCGIWRLGGFKEGDEKALVVKGFDAYFKLVRRLVITYSLEPAGSHGVWGLDDHVFLPYIFGSSQLTTFKSSGETGLEDADSAAEIAGVPKPAEVYKVDVIKEWRERNLYFGAVGFVMDVKKGPFWEHSPILYDISGVQKGWGKINEVGHHFIIESDYFSPQQWRYGKMNGPEKINR
jgi:serine/threonine-protein phosphatase 2A activator